MTKSPKSSPSNSPHYHTNGTVPSPSSTPPPPISHKSSTHQSPLHSNASSQPHLVDLATCNHQRVWRSVTRTLRRYLMCFKPEELRTKEKGKSNVLENGGDRKSTMNDGEKSPRNCNYYSEMNDEERHEQIKQAIIYCKNSTCKDDDPHKRRSFAVYLNC
ncbi:uncharacterized protein LOC130757685 [Actinidia eriantha]|uniref:uncharacterized protein LOC130757685 n=1 Tax=Actinidia eriantha TaxID=165200 RepID=UPI00258D2736|nr:uncharacterized protein LOC130757685 [Actinidia eriantha]